MSRPCRIIPVDRLRTLLAYDPETGIFRWRVRKSAHAAAGEIAGSDNRRGFLTICFDGVTYMAHRLAWAYVHGECEIHLRHINGNSLDNRIANLCCSEKTPGMYVPRPHLSRRFNDECSADMRWGPNNMDPDEFRAHLASLGLTVTATSKLLHVNRRTAQRWSAGLTPIPYAVTLLLRIASSSNIKASEIERLASGSPISAKSDAQNMLRAGL